MFSELTNFNNLKKHAMMSVILFGTGTLRNIKNWKSIFIFGGEVFSNKKTTLVISVFLNFKTVLI